MEEKKISEQWPEFYSKLKKADRSNMVRFSTSIDLIDKFNEPLFQYLSDKKIPVVYISNEKMKNSAIFQKFGNIPNALMWCVFMNFKGVERINIFVNTDGKALFNIAKIALRSRQDLFSMLETILVHESIHAYLFSMNFHVNYDATGRAMSMLHLITEKSKITNNVYIKDRLDVINNSSPQEVVTYILTESVLSDFVKSILIDGKNGWLAYCEFINYIDPFGILLKYAAKRQEIPDRVLADAEMKFRIYKHKGDTYERPVTVKEMKEGGVIMTNTQNKELTKNDFINILDKSQIPYHVKVSHIYGSTYLTINNDYYRVSDHPKKEKDSIYKEGINDFRSYNDLLTHIGKIIDLSDKTNAESEYKKNAEKLIIKQGDDFRTPNGRLFSNIDSALNNMWRYKIELDNYQKNDGHSGHMGQGGIIAGSPHSSGGVDAVIKETGQQIEVEGGEAIIKKKVVRSDKKYQFDGKHQTPRQILNKLNTDEGGNKI